MKSIRVVAVVLLVLAASCGGEPEDTSSAPELTRVRYYLGGIGAAPVAGAAPWFVGKEEGIFADAGIELEMLPGESPSALPGLLMSGEAELGSMDFVSLALARESDPDLKIQLVAMHHARAPYTVFSLEDGANIAEPSDLQGATIWSPVGGTTAKVVQVWARGHGVSGIQIKEADREALPRLLIAGKVPATVSTVFSRPGLSAAAQEAGKELVTLEVAEYGLDDFYGTGMAVSEEFAQANPDTVRAFVGAALESFEYSFAHPDEAGAIMEELYPTIPAAATIAAIKELEPVVTDRGTVDQIGTIDPVEVAATVSLAEEAFGIEIDPETLYTTEFLD